MDSIKARSQVKSEDTSGAWEKPTGTPAWEKPMDTSSDVGRVPGDVQSAKLKQLLGKIRQT
jgi:hypothetical protein